MADLATSGASGGQARSSAQGAGIDIDMIAFLCDEDSGQALVNFVGIEQAGQRVLRGGIAGATKYLAQNASPKLLMVDLSDSSDAMQDIDRLAEVVDPNTTVVAVGNTNDVTLYRELSDAGVADYLVKPLTPEILHGSLGKTIESIKSKGVARDAGRLVCVIGTRGGVGTSSVASNVACLLAQEMGQKVALIDLDLQFGTIALSLDVEAGAGLREALDDPTRIDSVFMNSVATKVGDNLYVIATEEGVGEGIHIQPEAMDMFITELRNEFDFIVVDMPRSMAVGHWTAISKSSSLVLVSDLSLAGLRDTSRLLAIAKSEIEAKNLLVAANRVGADKRAEIDPKEFEKAVERKINFYLPDDAKSLSTALNAAKSLSEVARSAKITGVLRQMCNQFLSGEEQGSKKSSWSIKPVKKT